MRLIDNWWRTLTHGYAQWCIYVSIVIQFLYDAVPTFSEVFPTWMSYSILGAALVARIVKQESVSAKPEAAP